MTEHDERIQADADKHCEEDEFNVPPEPFKEEEGDLDGESD